MRKSANKAEEAGREDQLNLDWEDIRAFVAIVRAGSLTLAAGTTGLSQPTLSRRLKSLEGAVGGVLFERLPNQMVLTSLGQRIAELGFTMELSAANLEREAAADLLKQRRMLRISATMSISLFLTEHLESLVSVAQRHACEVDIEPSRALLNLAYHQADLAIRLRHVPNEGLMRVRRIGRIAFTMYRAASLNGEQAPDVIGLSDNRPPPHPAWVDAYAVRHGLTIAARLGEFFQRHQAVASGLGISLLPCFVGDRDRRLCRVCEPPPELSEDAFLLLHNQAAASAGARAVADRIAELFHDEAARLDGQTVQPPA